MANITKIRVSGTTYTIVDESAVHSLAGYSTTAEMNAAITAATDALAQSVAEQGYQTSGDVQNAITGKADTTALTQVNNALTAHTADTTAHVTAADKSAWNAKVDTSDLASYADAVKYNSTSKYVEFYHGGTGGTKVFEYDASPFLVDGMIDSVEIKDVPLTEEATLTTTVTSYTFNSGATSEAIVKVTDGWWTDSQWKTTFLAFGGGSGSDCTLAQENGSIFFDNGTATNTGNTIHLQANNAFTNVYYQGITNLSYFESISAVYGSQTCLVISFNTDAGKQDINVPLTDIFDASNYYTTAQTQAYVSGYTYDKETIDNKITQSGTFDPTQYYTTANTYSKTEVNGLLDDKANTATTYTKTEVDTALGGKQATLVSGTNIKTVGGTSLLGSGNVATLHASLDGETLVLSES